MIILNGSATVAAPGPVASAWVNKYGVSEDASNILTSAIAGYANSHAGTVGSISSAGGYAEETMEETNKDRFFGIDVSDNPTSHLSMDYALYLTSSGITGEWENGVDNGALGVSYATGDVFRWHVSADGLVELLKNGAIIHTSNTKATTFPKYGNVAINQIGGTMKPITFGAVQPGSPPANAVTWRNKTGCAVGLSNVLAALVGGWGNSGATSSQQLSTGVGGTMTFVVKGVAGNTSIGLTTLATITTYTQITFGFLQQGGTTFYIFESGNNRGSHTIAANDVLKIVVSAAGLVVRHGVIDECSLNR